MADFLKEAKWFGEVNEWEVKNWGGSGRDGDGGEQTPPPRWIFRAIYAVIKEPRFIALALKESSYVTVLLLFYCYYLVVFMHLNRSTDIYYVKTVIFWVNLRGYKTQTSLPQLIFWAIYNSFMWIENLLFSFEHWKICFVCN